ncbi:hypothetical protein [Winogradskya humida]|uniref:hypothetical protein n=1 Tax=Winogradskya humida TaxID=113566 RepID=UPI001942E076|nr:hypothetical protein [Actinoplanes humidus]
MQQSLPVLVADRVGIVLAPIIGVEGGHNPSREFVWLAMGALVRPEWYRRNYRGRIVR